MRERENQSLTYSSSEVKHKRISKSIKKMQKESNAKKRRRNWNHKRVVDVVSPTRFLSFLFFLLLHKAYKEKKIFIRKEVLISNNFSSLSNLRKKGEEDERKDGIQEQVLEMEQLYCPGKVISDIKLASQNEEDATKKEERMKSKPLLKKREERKERREKETPGNKIRMANRQTKIERERFMPRIEKQPVMSV